MHPLRERRGFSLVWHSLIELYIVFEVKECWVQQAEIAAWGTRRGIKLDRFDSRSTLAIRKGVELALVFFYHTCGQSGHLYGRDFLLNNSVSISGTRCNFLSC